MDTTCTLLGKSLSPSFSCNPFTARSYIPFLSIVFASYTLFLSSFITALSDSSARPPPAFGTLLLDIFKSSFTPSLASFIQFFAAPNRDCPGCFLFGLIARLNLLRDAILAFSCFILIPVPESACISILSPVDFAQAQAIVNNSMSLLLNDGDIKNKYAKNKDTKDENTLGAP